MAGFKTHIGTSTVVGVAYGATGCFLGLPLADCILAGTLCSVSGMLPDLDSGSGVPVRETSAFLAAMLPLMLMNRLNGVGLPHEIIVVSGILMYIFVRFGLAKWFTRYTVHRGMWHSIPAAATAGLLTFILCQCDELDLRIYRSAAVVLGFLTHLILDEIWSVEVKGGRMRLKKSFGTAMKFWTSRGWWPNVSVYAKLVIVAAAAITDPILTERMTPQQQERVQTARSWWEQHVEGERIERY